MVAVAVRVLVVVVMTFMVVFTYCFQFSYQCLGWTTDRYLSRVTETVDRMEPFREIWPNVILY